MTIKELETWIKQVRFQNEKVTFSNSFDVEYETDEDYINVSFNYDFKKNRFECGVSIYHASEDNNAENVEAHTDEYDYHDDNLSSLVLKVADELGDDFTKAFNSDLEKAVI